MAHTTPYYIALTLLIITSAVTVITAPLAIFFLYRKIQPLQARSKVLLFVLYTCNYITAAIYFVDIESPNCQEVRWIQSIVGDYIMFGYMLAAYRLLVIFNITKEAVDSSQSDNEEGVSNIPATKTKKKKTIFNDSFYIQEKVLFVVLSAIVTFWTIIVIIAKVTTEGDEFCTSGINTIKQSLSLASLFIVSCFLAWRLRKVHDGYFIKNEFRLVILLVAVVLPFYLIQRFIEGETMVRWYKTVIVFTFCSLQIFSIGIPVFLSIKNFRKEYHDSSTSLYSKSEDKSSHTINMNPSTDSELEVKDAPSNKKRPFENQPKISKLLSDPRSLKFIKDFLIHYQLIQMGDYFNCWGAINDFREIVNKAFLPGKALLLFQKYFSANAYRPIDCCTDELRTKMQSDIDDAVNDKIGLDNDFFDPIYNLIEESLVANVFSPFFKSNFYQGYLEVTRLSQGLEQL